MKKVANVIIGVALISILLGIISRLTMKPLPIAPGGGIEASVLLKFAGTCLLLAIALLMSASVKE
ncbi:MAG: hypothetical protein AMJ95_11295 [Omnitrophica WOR_2 bacterium SM23_72]|nr:MAG: hypothetical protein AMJ95_11295 [Omnitrophica WOR_2 bacterium SM23_72]